MKLVPYFNPNPPNLHPRLLQGLSSHTEVHLDLSSAYPRFLFPCPNPNHTRSWMPLNPTSALQDWIILSLLTEFRCHLVLPLFSIFLLQWTCGYPRDLSGQLTCASLYLSCGQLTSNQCKLLIFKISHIRIEEVNKNKP